MTDAEFINTSRRPVSRARIRSTGKPKPERADSGSATGRDRPNPNDHSATADKDKRSAKQRRDVAARGHKIPLYVNFWRGLIEDHATRQASSAKITLWGAFFVGSWVIVNLTFSGKITEEFFLWYLAAFAANSVMSKITSARTRKREYEYNDESEYDVSRRRW